MKLSKFSVLGATAFEMVRGCEEGLDGTNFCYNANFENYGCSCPLTTCELDGGVGRCVNSPLGTALRVFQVMAVLAVVAAVSWCLCCKGEGCTATAPFKGGCWCSPVDVSEYRSGTNNSGSYTPSISHSERQQQNHERVMVAQYQQHQNTW